MDQIKDLQDTLQQWFLSTGLHCSWVYCQQHVPLVNLQAHTQFLCPSKHNHHVIHTAQWKSFHLYTLHQVVRLLNQPLQHGVFLAHTAWCHQPLQRGLIAIPPLSLDSKPVTRYFHFQHAYFLHATCNHISNNLKISPFIWSSGYPDHHNLPHIRYYNASLYHPVLLHQHAADGAASYNSAPSSILYGAEAMLGWPSNQRWKILFLCTLRSSFSSRHPPYTPIPRLSFCLCFSIC